MYLKGWHILKQTRHQYSNKIFSEFLKTWMHNVSSVHEYVLFFGRLLRHPCPRVLIKTSYSFISFPNNKENFSSFTPFEDFDILELALFFMQNFLDLERECLAWPHGWPLCKPSFKALVHCSCRKNLPVNQIATWAQKYIKGYGTCRVLFEVIKPKKNSSSEVLNGISEGDLHLDKWFCKDTAFLISTKCLTIYRMEVKLNKDGYLVVCSAWTHHIRISMG